MMDNFEWDKGYSERFGMMWTNFTDPKRNGSSQEISFIRFSNNKFQIERFQVGCLQAMIPSEFLKRPIYKKKSAEWYKNVVSSNTISPSVPSK